MCLFFNYTNIMLSFNEYYRKCAKKKQNKVLNFQKKRKYKATVNTK